MLLRVKLNDTAGCFLFKLLSLFAVFHLTAGIHLIQPALHFHLEHSACEHGILEIASQYLQECSGDWIQEIETKGEIHSCTICELLTTNQFYLVKSSLSYNANRQFFEIVSFGKSVSVTPCLSQHKPRAPPSPV